MRDGGGGGDNFASTESSCLLIWPTAFFMEIRSVGRLGPTWRLYIGPCGHSYNFFLPLAKSPMPLQTSPPLCTSCTDSRVCLVCANPPRQTRPPAKEG